MDVENDTNEEVEYTNPAKQCKKLAAGASITLKAPWNVKFYSKDSGCKGRVLGEGSVSSTQSLRLTYKTENFAVVQRESDPLPRQSSDAEQDFRKGTP